jgi:hypothetical protein
VRCPAARSAPATEPILEAIDWPLRLGRSLHRERPLHFPILCACEEPPANEAQSRMRHRLDRRRLPCKCFSCYGLALSV